MRVSPSSIARPAPMCSAPGDHRAQLDDLEAVAVQADARLAVDRVPAALQADRERGEREHRRADRERAARQHEVEQALAARVQVARARHDRGAYGPRPSATSAPANTATSAASCTHADTAVPSPIVASAATAAAARSGAAPSPSVRRNPTSPARYSAVPAPSASASANASAWPGSASACFSPGRDRDDPEQQQQVPVAERLQREARPALRRRGGHRRLGERVVVAPEVRPPQARAQRQAERRDQR